MKTLIIGYGSTLRCDDGVGYLIAEKLIEMQESGALANPAIEIHARQQLTPDLADQLAGADTVIFIDACADGAPGEVRVREVAPKGENWGAFAHEMPPEILLDCVKDVFGKVPQAKLITIGGEDFSIGEGLTEKVSAAMPQVIQLALA